MLGVKRVNVRTSVLATLAGVSLLGVIMAWRRVPLLDRLVLDQSRPYVHQSVVTRR